LNVWYNVLKGTKKMEYYMCEPDKCIMQERIKALEKRASTLEIIKAIVTPKMILAIAFALSLLISAFMGK
jgi:hypothetical protein